MNRVDIFANQALEDIIESGLLELELHYTKLEHLGGSGNKGFCLNNDIWPEGNTGYSIFCEERQLLPLKELLKSIKSRFPVIGLHSFIKEGWKEFI